MKHFNRLLSIVTLCAGVAALGLTGCAWQHNKEARETGRTPEQLKTDKSISEQVSNALTTAPVYKYPEVKVETLDGNIALSGFVRTQEQKDAATRIAQDFSPGHQVYNNLVVQPLTPTGRTGQQLQNQNQEQQTPPQSQPNVPPSEQPK